MLLVRVIMKSCSSENHSGRLFSHDTYSILVFQAGRHVHLSDAHQLCVDWKMAGHKSWMLASLVPMISLLGAVFTHAPGSLLSIRGTHVAPGEFLSRQTAYYPKALAAVFANLINPLVSQSNTDWSLQHQHQLLPVMGLSDPSYRQEDGSGLPSLSVWSSPDKSLDDCFGPLRQQWLYLPVQHKLDRKNWAYFSQGDYSYPPFSEEDQQMFRLLLESSLTGHGFTPNWQMREHQSIYLSYCRI